MAIVSPLTPSSSLDKKAVLAAAAELGADLVGVTDLAPLTEQAAHLERWLAAGRQGCMHWLEKNSEQRSLQRSPFPGARSIIVIALNYYTPAPDTPAETPYRVSRYARGRDYHKVMKRLLKGLSSFIQEHTGYLSRSYTDSGPVLEKALAQRAGLGWIGRNSLLLNRQYGSWLFLGELFTELELEPDRPHPDLCENCRLCLDACPTTALTSERVLDSPRCISYATVEKPVTENNQVIPAGYIFGCDICQEICPWNREAVATEKVEFRPGPLAEQLQKGDIPQDEAQWELLNRGTTLRRISYEQLLENVARVDREKS